MRKILIIDNSRRDADRLASLCQANYNAVSRICDTGASAELAITEDADEIAAVFLLHEIPGPPFAFQVLLQCRQTLRQEIPVVIVSSALDASLATRAYALGARDFLEKPLDIERVKTSLDRLLAAQVPELPIVKLLNETVLGQSTALLATLREVANVIPHPETRVLLIGESGTGKELLAQAMHRFGPCANEPCVAVNVAAVPKDLMESQFFGHEKGAFTSAVEAHRGFLEEAAHGTLFLDEIGELDLQLQVKLLRVIQERKFRRLSGTRDLEFNARLICATNRDLARFVMDNSFRSDLFHRISELTIHVPPLRERKGDIDVLLDCFLAQANGEKPPRLARETLSILRSYTFPGNIRELENLIRTALIHCNGDWILPDHLPLNSMGVFLAAEENKEADRQADVTSPANELSPFDAPFDALFNEVRHQLPANWSELPYKEMLEHYRHAFDRVYLTRLIARYRHNVTQATKAAGMDKKTFDRHWKESGLNPLRSGEDTAND